MARFGQLYLQKGEWNGKQVISRKWVTETLKPYSIFPDGTAYGYLWWIDTDFHGDTVYYASGYGGQMILIWPSEKIVLALNADTYSQQQVRNRYMVIRNLLITARNGNAVPDPGFTLLGDSELIQSIVLLETEKKKYIGKHRTGNNTFYITDSLNGLLLEKYHYFYKFRLLPVAPGQFYVEDLDLYLLFSFDENNHPVDPEFHSPEK